MAVADGVGKGIRRSLSGSQRLGGSGIRRVGVAAVRGHLDAAIGAHNTGTDIAPRTIDRTHRQGVAAIRVTIVAQRPPGHRRPVGRDRSYIVNRIGRVILAADGNHHIGRRRAALAIANCVGKPVAERLARCQRIDGWIAVVQRVGIAAVRQQLQLPVNTGHRSPAAGHRRQSGQWQPGAGTQCGHGQRVAVEVGIVEQCPAGGIGRNADRAFVDRIGIGVRHRRIVRAIDGDRQRCGCRAPVAIADRVGIGFGQRLTGAQGRDGRVGRVNAEAVGTVGIQGQRAGAAHQRHADRTTSQAGHAERVCIHIAVIAQDSTGHRRRGGLAQTVAVVLRDRRIIDRRHIDRCRACEGNLLAVGRGIGIHIADRPLEGARAIARVLGSRIESDTLQGSLILRQRGCPRQCQNPGRGIVAARNAGLIDEIEPVAGNKTSLNTDDGLIHLRVIKITQCQPRFQRDGRAVFGITAGTAGATDDGGIVNRRQRDVARGGGRRSTGTIRIGIGHGDGQRPPGARRIRGRIVTGAREAERTQHLLVIRGRVVAAEGEHARRRVVDRGNAGACGIHRQRITGDKAAGADAYGRRSHLTVVGIAQRQPGIYQHRHRLFGVTHGGWCHRQHRRIIAARDVDRRIRGHRQTPASPLVDTRTSDAPAGDIGILVIDGIGQRHRSGRIVTGVAIRQPLHDLIGACRRGVGIEGNAEDTAALGVATDRHARQLYGAARGQNQAAGSAENVIGIPAATA